MSLMFVAWFVSGIVLIFDGFPHASREGRFLHLEEFKEADFEVIQAPPASFKGKVSLELSEGRAVYRVKTGKKAQKTYDAVSLQPIASFGEDHAKQLSSSFNGYPVKKIEKIDELDDWTPWSYYKPLLPFYKCSMSDPAHSVLYISEKTGEIVQETNRRARWSARFGAIPHWIYFKKLRMAKDTWRLVVIILSSIGILMTLTGIYAGIVRIRKRKKESISPYKKFWYKWHHLTGFFFGLFVFTFILSGLISVANIPDWMVGVNSKEKKKISWNQKLDLAAFENTTPKEIFKGLKNKTGIRKIEWKTVFGQPQFRVYYHDYQQSEVYCLKGGNVVPQKKFSLSDIENQAKVICKDLPFTLSHQANYDNYYSGSAMHYLPSTAYKIELSDAAQTWLYIDPASGERIKKLTKNSRVRRWLYRFLHTFDIPILKKYDWIRKTILLLLSFAGLAVSITGLVISVKWFKRNFKKSVPKKYKTI
ncbi:PepSY domain-containing protein [Marinifilum caeruleilacunae]|uniref:PepSY domain-containing protein n=1 Tax=Marinifilum caeruleilacunae TaxID=2499076 RepID=A0ABX1WZ09_9BACT|nr:hypothetical protein [Marinifilum caeruleilacunae]